MKFLKIFSIFLTLIIFNGCVQTTSLLAPGITIATTGNILQAGFQYGANTAIKNETGKDTFTHLKDAVNGQKLKDEQQRLKYLEVQRQKEEEQKKKDEKFKIKFKEIVEKRFNSTRQKLFIN